MINEQEGLYTLYLQGSENGKAVRYKRVITSVSRCIDPYRDFDMFMDCAKNPDIRLKMILPCRDQAARWPKKFQRAYENIISSADEVLYLGETYDQFCMQRRNRHLVDSADILMCYLTRSFGGTMSTVNYAYDKELRIINLATLLK